MDKFCLSGVSSRVRYISPVGALSRVYVNDRPATYRITGDFHQPHLVRGHIEVLRGLYWHRFYYSHNQLEFLYDLPFNVIPICHLDKFTPEGFTQQALELIRGVKIVGIFCSPRSIPNENLRGFDHAVLKGHDKECILRIARQCRQLGITVRVEEFKGCRRMYGPLAIREWEW